jgi:hypothetical protein
MARGKRAAAPVEGTDEIDENLVGSLGSSAAASPGEAAEEMDSAVSSGEVLAGTSNEEGGHDEGVGDYEEEEEYGMEDEEEDDEGDEDDEDATSSRGQSE